ncbi:MAG TPA: phosphopantetheine-binding protein [Bryobacteraceae bacterium]|nr:phosphopantetheine-binding protein [Bryobacteraceae bacterium]
MDSVTEKLNRCFAATFPTLDPGRYAQASVENLGEWDSIKQLTLLTVIGEEFGREIDFEEFEDATSYEALVRILEGD